MKRLLILLCLPTLFACGPANKFLNSGTDGLGVPKQRSEVVFVEESNTSGLPETIAGHKVTYSNDTTESTTPNEASPKETETSFNWYYLILVGILVIVAFLVYRLKRQSMSKS